MPAFLGIESCQQSPSFFELLMQEQVKNEFPSAVGYILQTLPGLFAVTERWGDELIAVCTTFWESYFMKIYDSSSIEHLFGLRRGYKSSSPQLRRPLPRDRTLGVLSLVIVQYIRSKLEKFHGNRAASLVPFESQSVNEQQIFGHKLFVIIGFLERICTSTYQILYLTGRRKNFDWTQHALGFELLRSTGGEESVTAQRAVESTRSYFWKALPTALATLLLAVKTAEWWVRASSTLQPSSDVTMRPPPPKTDEWGSDMATMSCSLCEKIIANCTVTPSGSAFCYGCVFHYVSSYAKCPSSGLPCTINDLRRIYQR